MAPKTNAQLNADAAEADRNFVIFILRRAGHSVEAVARRLNVSRRTVERVWAETQSDDNNSGALLLTLHRSYLNRLHEERPQTWLGELHSLKQLLKRYGPAAMRRAFDRGMRENSFGAERIAVYLDEEDLEDLLSF